MKKWWLLIILCLASCQAKVVATPVPATAVAPTPTSIPTPTPPPMGAGFRYSTYGPWRDPGKAYCIGLMFVPLCEAS